MACKRRIFGLQQWAFFGPWNLTWQLWQSARPQNREVNMDKVGISDYMTALDYSEIPEKEWERPRILTFCCFNLLEATVSAKWFVPPGHICRRHETCVFSCWILKVLFLSHAFHIALVASYDGCPDGEGCSRTEVLIKTCSMLGMIWFHTWTNKLYVDLYVSLCANNFAIYLYVCFDFVQLCIRHHVYIYIHICIYIFIFICTCLSMSHDFNQA